MREPNGPQAALTAHEHQLNLRRLQEETIASLYAGTGVLCFALVLANYSLPRLSPAAVPAMAVMVALYPLHRLLARHYRARAWLLVALWLAAGISIMLWLPASPAPCLFTLPVAMALLLLGRGAALRLALGATAVAAVAGALGLSALPGESWAIAGVTLWGTVAILVFWLRPMDGTLRWSWERYDWVRRQMEQARDAQAELKQAVRDLADASSQMARLNQLLGAARRAPRPTAASRLPSRPIWP